MLRVPQGRASAVSADGKRFATTGQDGTATVWETDTGTRLLTLLGHKGPVNGIAFSPDGSLLATTGDDRTVRLWDATSGRKVHVLRGHRDGPGRRVQPRRVAAGDREPGQHRADLERRGGTQHLVLRGPPGQKFWNLFALPPPSAPTDPGSQAAGGKACRSGTWRRGSRRSFPPV